MMFGLDISDQESVRIAGVVYQKYVTYVSPLPSEGATGIPSTSLRTGLPGGGGPPRIATGAVGKAV